MWLRLLRGLPTRRADNLVRGVISICIVFREELLILVVVLGSEVLLDQVFLAFRMLLRVFCRSLVLLRLPGSQHHVQFLSQFQMKREI